MSELGNKIEKINQYIGTHGHDITSFIYFKVNRFELDTRSKDSFKHYAISLENQKTGVGQGNKFILKIAFHPDFSHLGVDNINKFEEMLSLVSSASLGNKTDDVKSERNKCVLKYGYIANNAEVVSPTYEGILLKYSVTANKQIVEYTLEGYTGEKAAISTINWYPKIKNIDKSSNEIIANIVSTAEAKNLSDEERDAVIKELDSIYTGPLKSNPYFAMKAFITDYNDTIKASNPNATTFSVVLGRYRSDKALTEDDMRKLRNVTLSLCRNQTPLQYVEYLVSMFVEDTGNQYALAFSKAQNKIVDRWVYELRRSKSNYNVIEIVINKVSSDDTGFYDYHFKGYAPNNNLLIDYTLNYDGTVALVVNDTMNNSTSEDSDNIYIDSRGQLQRKAVITRNMFVEGALDEVQVKEENLWLDRMSCSNNCTLTTFGLPFEIPVSAIFRITLYIKDKPHHESGNCYVTGIVDKINNGQFTTTFSMIRLPGKGADVQ